MAVLKSQIQKVDRLLLFLVVGLVFFGVLMVYDSSMVTAFRHFGDKYFYVRQQALFTVLGLGMMAVIARIDYHRLAGLVNLLMLGVIILLVLVLIPGLGTSALGARRWLGVSGFSFQPAEVAKLVFVLYLAKMFTQKAKLLPFLAISGILSLLIMLEPDLGTTVIILTSGFLLFFAAGANLFFLVPVGIISILSGIVLILTSPYRKERFLTFFDSSRDPLGASYHIRQALIALGSGGLFGLGVGASRQKYEYLPESMTDSIFAVIGEELGFLGATVLVLTFLFLIWRGFKIATQAPDRFGQLLAIGISSWVGVQAMVNLGAMVALVPLTGVPLPFISYGGSSLVITLMGAGVLLNISKHKVKKK